MPSAARRWRIPPDPTPPKQPFDPRQFDSLTYTKRRDREPLSRIDGDAYMRGRPFRTRVERELMGMVAPLRKFDLKRHVIRIGYTRSRA